MAVRSVGSPGVAGARSAAPIATAWAVLHYLGIEGYVDVTRELAGTTATMRAAIASIPELEVVGDPIGPVMAMASSTIAIAGVGNAMDDRGWHLNRIVDPPGLHLMLSPAHALVVDELIADLGAAVAAPSADGTTDVRYS